MQISFTISTEKCFLVECRESFRSRDQKKICILHCLSVRIEKEDSVINYETPPCLQVTHFHKNLFSLRSLGLSHSDSFLSLSFFERESVWLWCFVYSSNCDCFKQCSSLPINLFFREERGMKVKEDNDKKNNYERYKIGSSKFKIRRVW